MSLNLWTGLIRNLFPKGMPTAAVWTDLDSMGLVLNHIGSRRNASHMFYPTGGGMDLQGAIPFDEEPGCLALSTGRRVAEVVKPTALLFDSFGTELEWAYFRLECEPLAPCGVYKTEGKDDKTPPPKSEEVVLVEPGTYAERSAWDAVEFRGQRLPESAQLITRSLGGGPFVIFAKGSLYSAVHARGFDAYDGRHAKMDAAEFRKFIAKLARG